MKIIFTLLFSSIFAFGIATAQERYLDEIFTEVNDTTVLYGGNATVLFLPFTGGAELIPLPMDVYYLSLIHI